MSSNDITQVRSYLNSRINSIYPDLKEWKDSLEEIGNIPKTLLDRSYHIALGVSSSTAQIDRHIEDDFTVVISIFKRAYNSPTETSNELLQKANCIRLDLIKPLNVESYKSANDGNIEDVQSVSLTPGEIAASNDNIIKVEIELNVRLFFPIT